MKRSPQLGIELPGVLAFLGEQLFEFEEQKPCIYFLVKDLEMYEGYKMPRIVYVGSSHDLANRLKSHSRKYEYDRVYFIELDGGARLAKIEHALIQAMQPEYNINGKSRPSRLWDKLPEAVLREHGVRVYDRVRLEAKHG